MAPDTIIQNALVLLAQGKGAEAAALLSRSRGLQQVGPHSGPLLVLMSRAQTQLGAHDKALYFAERGFSVLSGDENAAIDYLRCAWKTGIPATAESVCRAIAAAPVFSSLKSRFFTIASSQAMGEERHGCALAINRYASNQFPDDLEVQCGLGSLLLTYGDPEAADDHVQSLLSRLGAQEGIRALDAVVSNYARESQESIFASHRALGAMLERTSPPEVLPPRDPDPARPLCIGLISGDFYDHAVVRFLWALLEAWSPANRPAGIARVDAFMTNRLEDRVTRQIRERVDSFTYVEAQHAPEETRRTLLAAGLDVIIDLAGLLPGQCVEVLVRRCAPVQITMIGYPGTTGISAMDVRVVDALTDPTGAADACATERLARVDPCFLCYSPREDAPELAARDGQGPIVFGSFNTLQKVTMRTLSLWSRVLERVPESRLLIKSRYVNDPHIRAGFLGRCERAGLDPARVDFMDFVRGKADALGAYSRMDIALDTLPYHGTTTSCEALWMGVPVVSRIGTTHASRVGLSLLSAVGRPEWACESDESFAETAGALASDRAKLRELRLSLRERMRASPLCDAAGYALRITTLVREAWAERCAGEAR
jgi:protein O-GlcNAc transferase